MKNTLFALLLTGTLAASSFAQINQRFENQQDRIASGIRSGRLNAGETAHLERREARIGREVRFDRAQNGGHLSSGERARVNHQLNHVSRQIARDKH